MENRWKKMSYRKKVKRKKMQALKIFEKGLNLKIIRPNKMEK